jgi:CheY-like chemotaxis protein
MMEQDTFPSPTSSGPPGASEWAVSEEQLKQFRAFMAGKKVLIADTNQSIRSSLSTALTELGVKANLILLASSHHDACEQIRGNAPEVVLCDYHLDARYGLELMAMHRHSRPDLESRLFVLVTGNSSEAAVAEAAEEDVDAFILKPFTGASIRYYLVRSALNKARPSTYRAELARGRKWLESGELDQALECFKTAMKLDAAPALACYYKGQSHEKLAEWDNSESSYRNGLEYNGVHYRCSIALFDFYVAQKRTSDAYSVMRKISQNFPISPQRLSKAIELAVRTQNFADISHFHAVFTQLDERRDELRKYVCAALVVGAMFHLRHKRSEEALTLLQNAAITAGGSPTTLREIVMLLVKFNLPDPAEVFLRRFSPEDRINVDFLCSDFAVLDIMPGTKVEDIIVRGRKLIRDGVREPVIHRILIRREKQTGHLDLAENLLTDALSAWPDQADSFRKAWSGTE